MCIELNCSINNRRNVWQHVSVDDKLKVNFQSYVVSSSEISVRLWRPRLHIWYFHCCILMLCWIISQTSSSTSSSSRAGGRKVKFVLRKDSNVRVYPLRSRKEIIYLLDLLVPISGIIQLKYFKKLQQLGQKGGGPDVGRWSSDSDRMPQLPPGFLELTWQ